MDNSLIKIIEIICEILIAVFGPISIYFIGHKNATFRKIGFIIGLALQPPWFFVAIVARQWGVVVVEFGYLYGWWIGFKNHVLDSKAKDTT